MNNNFQQPFSPPEENTANLYGGSLKNIPRTTQGPAIQNIEDQQIPQNRICWNNNKNYPHFNFSKNLTIVDALFQQQLLKQHTEVIKNALNIYYSNLAQREHEIGKFFHQNGPHELYIDKINSFCQELKHYKQFNENQIESLKLMLLNNQYYWKILQKFSQIVPYFLKGEFYHVMFKGLEFSLRLAEMQDKLSSQNLYEYILQNFDQIYYENSNLQEQKENCQGFIKMASTIIYTLNLYIEGKSKNMFFDSQLSQSLSYSQANANDILKLHSINSSKYIKTREVNKTNSKKIIYLKRSTSYPSVDNQGRAKKRKNFDNLI